MQAPGEDSGGHPRQAANNNSPPTPGLRSMNKFKPILFTVAVVLGTLFVLFRVAPMNVRKLVVG